MSYSATKFEVATSNCLGGDTFTRNLTDAHPHGRTSAWTHGRTEGRRTDFGTKLIYTFFLKEKAGITSSVVFDSLFNIPPIDCGFVLYCALLGVLSSFAIMLTRKRELVA